MLMLGKPLPKNGAVQWFISASLIETMFNWKQENENNGNKIVCNTFCFPFTSLIVTDASKKFANNL